MSVAVKQTLGRNQRISRRGEISSILKKGQRRRFSQFDVIYEPNAHNHDRIAVLVSRRTGNAVERAAVKRAVREIFRRNKSQVPPYFDILVRPVSFQAFSRKEAQDCFVGWRESLAQPHDD